MPHKLAAWTQALILAAWPITAQAQGRGPAADPGPWAIAAPGSFFASGRDVPATTLSTLPAFPGERTVMIGQMDVRFQVPGWLASLPLPNPSVPELSAAAPRLDGAVLVSHSQSGIYPFQTVVRSRKGVAGMVAIEPGACPAASDSMAPFAALPILVLWGDNVNLSPRWAPRLVACRDSVTGPNPSGG